MSFSQTTILAVNPPQYQGALVFLSWTSSSPTGTWFQIYVDQALAWFGQSTSARLTVPPIGVTRVDIGTVAAGGEQTDFSSSLPSAPGRRVELTWVGGMFEGADITGFRVFGSDAAGGPVDLTTILADITAYPSGIITDGFGMGSFGGGGFGTAAGTYTWTSDKLTAGTWSYAVIPYDQAGNLGTAAMTSMTIIAPPLAPASFADGLRLHYTFNQPTKQATLFWNGSPG